MSNSHEPKPIYTSLAALGRALITFLGTMVFSFGLAFSAHANELVCEKTDAGWALPENSDWQEADAGLYEQIAQIGSQAALIREALFVRTNSQPQTQNFTSMAQATLDLQKKLNARIQSVIDSGQTEFTLIEAYLQAARSVLLIDLTLQQDQKNPYARALAYGLTISLDAYKAIFNSDYRYVPGTMFVKNQNNYLLTFSNSTVLSLYLRALARSPKGIENSKAAMLKTLKCALSVTHTQKLLHHQALTGDKNKFTLAGSTSICPSVSLQDATKASQTELQGLYEDMFRQSGVGTIPTAYDNLDEKTSYAIVTQPTLAVAMPRMILQPEDLALALSAYGVDINKLDLDIEVLLQKIMAQSETVYNDPNLKVIRATLTPAVSELLLPFAKSCGVKNDTQILNHNILAVLDGYFFPIHIQSQLSSLKLRLLDLNEKEQLNLVKNLIVWARKDSVYEAYRQAFDYLRNPLSPEAVDMVFAAQNQIDSALETEMMRPEVQKSLEALAEKILQSMKAEFKKTNTGLALRQPLVMNAAKVSQQIAGYLDENTDAKKLPYVQAAIERAFEGRLNELTGIHRSYFGTIAQKADFFAQKEAWGLVSVRLKAKADELNTTCETPGFWGNARQWALGQFFKQSEEARLFSVQCHILQTYAALVGLNETARPKHIGDYWSTLESTFKDDELNEYLKIYRKELEFENYKVVPLLTAEIQGKNLWLRLNAAKSESEKDQLVQSALRESQSILDSSLAQIQQAQKLEDLATFFKRTKTLKVIFGGEQETQSYLQSLGLRDYQAGQVDDLSLDAGVMTQMRAEHDIIQNNFYRTERIQSEIFSDYVMSHVFIGWGFLAGTAIKYGARFTPGFVGGPALSRFIDIRFNRLRDLMIFQANTFTSILAYQIGIAQIEKESFRTELQNIRQLYQSELSGMQGSLSLISFQEFIRQRHYVDYMLDELTTLQKWNAAFVMLPIVLDQALRKGHLLQARLRDMRNLKLERLTPAERAAIENKIMRQAKRQKSTLTGDMKRLGAKDLYLSQLQAGVERVRRNAKSKHEIQLAEESYARIVFEIGKETEALLGKQHLLEVYRRSALGADVSIQELYKFYNEYQRVYAAWFKPAVTR